MQNPTPNPETTIAAIADVFDSLKGTKKRGE
jgi:hypothetical protein